MIKLLFYDLETTGLNHKACGIHQLAGQVHLSKANNKLIPLEKFDLKFRPHDHCHISDKALEIGGVTKEQIMAYPKMEDQFAAFKDILGKQVDKYDKNDKMTLVGYNINSFDNFFLRDLFHRNNDKHFGSWFFNASIDLYPVVAYKLKSRIDKPQNFKLSSVCEYFGIDIDDDELHNAQYDVNLCVELYKKLGELDVENIK